MKKTNSFQMYSVLGLGLTVSLGLIACQGQPDEAVSEVESAYTTDPCWGTTPPYAIDTYTQWDFQGSCTRYKGYPLLSRGYGIASMKMGPYTTAKIWAYINFTAGPTMTWSNPGSGVLDVRDVRVANGMGGSFAMMPIGWGWLGETAACDGGTVPGPYEMLFFGSPNFDSTYGCSRFSTEGIRPFSIPDFKVYGWGTSFRVGSIKMGSAVNGTIYPNINYNSNGHPPAALPAGWTFSDTLSWSVASGTIY